VVLEVVLLEFAPVGWEAGKNVLVNVILDIRLSIMNLPLVVQEVVRAVIANVAENAAAVDCHCRVPVVEEDGMGEFPEWRGKNQEERGRHDESQAVHWKIVVNTVQQEVCSDCEAVVG
jgi:hypothetical protein